MGFVGHIPRRLLPDAMLVRVPTADGGLSDPVELDGVRFCMTQSASTDAHRSADAGSGEVFVDAASTDGAFEVPVGSRVEIRGVSYRVARCRRCETTNGVVHHWELVVR